MTTIERAAAADRFTGAWSVREHVFIDGVERGTIAQRRVVATTAHADRLRVHQDCAPSASLAACPIARFGGHHEFELQKDGRWRHYLGPAVIGAGLELGPGVMTGRGEWPQLGWAFTSWAFLVAPDRQLTGGTFRVGDETIATIVGVGGPEGVAPAALVAVSAAEIASTWRGVATRYAPDGERLEAWPIARVVSARGWTQAPRAPTGDGDDEALVATGPRTAQQLTGTVSGRRAIGIGCQLGAALAFQLELDGGHHLRALEVVDLASRRLVSLREHHRGDRLAAIDVLHLSPQGALA